MPDPPLIDVRPEPEFLRAHAPQAASFPLEELAQRVHELPARNVPLRVTDPDPTRTASARAFLTTRGNPVEIVPFEAAALTAWGASSVRLWQPSPFLIEALDAIESRRSLRGLRALDVACGSGRDAVYLALRGLDVTAIDLLPDALQRASDLARRSGVTLKTLQHDLEAAPSLPQPTADVICVFRYLHRPLFPILISAISRGGHLIYETFHEANRQTGRRPLNPHHLLGAGELVTSFGDLETIIFREAFERDGRFFSCLLAHVR